MKVLQKYLFHFVLLINFLICESILFSKCFITEPQCPNQNVSFYLYTRETQNQPSILNLGDSETIFNAKFSVNRPLVLLIHGYTGDKDYAPNKQIRPAYFLKNDFNIISVDYSNLADEPCYFWAVKNLPTVANCSGQLLNFLMDANIFKVEDIHVIGFSLGAQVAGMIANYMEPGRKLKRITGLDPAKPLFVGVKLDNRLDEGDAEFVDIIHTDIFARGFLLPSGHADYFVNGGFNQPGCFDQQQTSPGSCNHERAPEYYAESVNSEDGFWGFPCAHWYFYALGLCQEKDTDVITEMGYNANKKTRGIYFLYTNPKPPFARGKNFTTQTVALESEIPMEEEENF